VYGIRYAREGAWREDIAGRTNGTHVDAGATLAVACKPSVDFCGYLQRAQKEASRRACRAGLFRLLRRHVGRSSCVRLFIVTNCNTALQSVPRGIDRTSDKLIPLDADNILRLVKYKGWR
jgi:hypothetical protein